MGGSPKRMRKIAESFLKTLNIDLPCGNGLINIACTTDRYEMYKVGPILAVSVSDFKVLSACIYSKVIYILRGF